MIEKHRKNREQVEIFSIEEFVPATLTLLRLLHQLTQQILGPQKTTSISQVIMIIFAYY